MSPIGSLKRRACIVLWLAVGLSSPSFGQSGARIAGSPDFQMAELNTLLGRVARSLGNEIVITRDTMPRLLHWWDERAKLGDANGDLSNAFLFVMEENAKAFFSYMSGHPKEFSDWLDNLQDLSFTWETEPPCPLDAKRKQLIQMLSEGKTDEPNSLRLRNATVARLSKIRCRQIQ